MSCRPLVAATYNNVFLTFFMKAINAQLKILTTTVNNTKRNLKSLDIPTSLLEIPDKNQ